MNWSSLKNLMISGRERFVIIENDEPEFVVLSLDEYQRLIRGESAQQDHGVNDQLQGIAQDTAEFSAPIGTGVVAPNRFNRDFSGGVHIEDLPL